ncbi:hypothetical protein ACKKBF_B09595 [Auxenochlorella protothecoides x Auxenochlorella symbiontica]
MVNSDIHLCPTLRPTRQQFERPFAEFVREQFLKHPEWACFKVIPPKRWKPNKRGKYDLENVRIATPIKQHVFGKSGAYRCILEEQRGMMASDFEKMASGPSHKAPERGHRDDDFLERSFWSSVTINPPLYGADVAVSFFDERLDFGWNLRRLGCLLSQYDVPEIPGVTSPMAYFGTWKSFFGWHKEDIDLYSINYNHAGAAKIWYCVSPRDGHTFDRMARGLFPELHAACPAFVRHKDIMISPRLLRAAGVPFVQARQEPGEFIVLNAAAYHSGFNLGFNIAEAVNFALPEWLPVGRAALNCECSAMSDGVCLDMGIFFSDLRREDSSSGEDEEGEEEDEEGSGEEAASGEDEEAGAGEDEEAGAGAASSSGEESAAASSSQDRDRGSEASTSSPPPARKPRGRAARAAEVGRTAAAQGRGAGRAAKRARERGEDPAPDRPPPDPGSEGSSATEVSAPVPAAKRARAPPRVPAPHAPAPGRPPAVPAGALHPAWGAVAEEKPLALVERALDGERAPYFTLVHRLARAPTRPGSVWLGLLKEGCDGLFRPTGVVRQAMLGMHFPRLVHVRSDWTLCNGRRRRGGWRLTTLRKRILM